MALSVYGQSQVSNYQFNHEFGQPWEISNYPNVQITNHQVLNDSIYPSNISIPFNFKFNSETKTNLTISENGFVWFGNNVMEAKMNKITYPISDVLINNQINGLIAAVGTNLYPHNETNFFTQIRSGVVGTAPMRILIIEWKNTSRYENKSENVALDTISFQIKLYETTNRIEIAYFDFKLNPLVTTLAEVGLRGVKNDDFNNRSTAELFSNWDSTQSGESVYSNCELSETSFPLYGHLFVWSPAERTGIKEQMEEVSKVYPIPATNNLTITNNLEKETQIFIYNIMGELVYQNKFSLKHEIDIKNWNSGVYILRLTYKNGISKSKRIIIENS